MSNANSVSDLERAEHDGDYQVKKVSQYVSNGDGTLSRAKSSGIVCSKNTTFTPLAADGVFTGEAGDVKDFGALVIGIYADVPSATNGLEIQFSADSTNWHTTDEYTYLDNGVTKVYTFTPVFRYYRIVYTNGSTEQTTFQLQSILKSGFKPSSHKIQDTLADEDDGELQISVLKLKTAANTYVSGTATQAGNFKVSLEEYETATNPVRPNMEGGGKVSVGTTAVELTFTGTTKSILITADLDNSGIIYIGKSNVASDGSNAFTVLYPGDSVTIDYDDSTNAVYAVGSAASQNVWKGALL